VSVPSGPGLAQERTAFAWRRTALSVAVGSLLCLRVLPPQLGPAGWALAVLGLCWSADLASIGWRRQHDLEGALQSGSARPHGGAGVVRTAGITIAVGVIALVAAVLIAGRTLSG
jgi:uncharacterized membrane protein YidH (DUF202 family)